MGYQVKLSLSAIRDSGCGSVSKLEITICDLKISEIGWKIVKKTFEVTICDLKEGKSVRILRLQFATSSLLRLLLFQLPLDQ